jgi:hypothetical protein
MGPPNGADAGTWESYHKYWTLQNYNSTSRRKESQNEEQTDFIKVQVKVGILNYLDKIDKARMDSQYEFGPILALQTSFCCIQNLSHPEVACIEVKGLTGVKVIHFIVKTSSSGLKVS